MTPKQWAIILVAGIAFGASFGFNQILLDALGPMSISALRIGIGALGCWLWVLARRSGNFRLPDSAGKLALLGIFQFALPFAILPFAQVHITSSVAGIANALTPVATVIVSYLLMTGERVGSHKLLGIAFGVLGTAALVSGGGVQSGSDPVFVLLAITAPFSYAVALNLAKQLRVSDPVLAITWAMTFGFVFIAPIALAFEGLPGPVGSATVVTLATLGIGLTAIPFLVLYSLMAVVGAVNVSLVTYIAPVSALLIGVVIFGDNLVVSHLLGIVFIMSGLVAIDGRFAGIVAGYWRKWQHRAHSAAVWSNSGSH